jgi:ribosomal protein S18 acetylase RimI-like enzyme
MKRVLMSLELTRQCPRGPSWPCRAIRASDAEDLAMLLYAAFRGTIDDTGETFADAEKEIERTLAGDYGRLLFDCSFTIEARDVLSSACLISWYEPVGSPFVAFTMTRPENKAQGMARFLLQQSINALLDRGYACLSLIVTEQNQPAFNLYTSLGFVAKPKE